MQVTYIKTLRKLPMLLSLATALVAGGVMAGPGKGGDADQHLERITAQLSLNEEQQAEWRELHEAGREEAASDHQRVREIQGELRNLRADFDQARARQLTGELGAIQARQALRRVEHQAAIYQLLEPEQRERWEAATERRHDKAGKSRKAWRGGGQRGEGKCDPSGSN